MPKCVRSSSFLDYIIKIVYVYLQNQLEYTKSIIRSLQFWRYNYINILHPLVLYRIIIENGSESFNLTPNSVVATKNAEEATQGDKKKIVR